MTRIDNIEVGETYEFNGEKVELQAIISRYEEADVLDDKGDVYIGGGRRIVEEVWISSQCGTRSVEFEEFVKGTKGLLD